MNDDGMNEISSSLSNAIGCPMSNGQLLTKFGTVDYVKLIETAAQHGGKFVVDINIQET